MLPFVFEEGFGFERYVDYALDVPMYFVYRDGRYIDALGQSFRDFLAGRLPALPGEIATLSDWADHLTTIFPEARLKKFIEMRGADGGPWRRLCALPALWVGLLYDQGALDAAWDLAKGWTRRRARRCASRPRSRGCRARPRRAAARPCARGRCDRRGGLKARAMPRGGRADAGRDAFPQRAEGRRDSGMTPADELIARYEGAWAGDVTRVFGEYSY
jgi:glutamate--cysteine ligase